MTLLPRETLLGGSWVVISETGGVTSGNCKYIYMRY